MAAALNDIVQVVVRQTMSGQEILNRYWFRVVALTGLGEGYLEIVRDHMLTVIIPAVRAIQGANLQYHGIDIVNFTNGIDFLNHVISPFLPGSVPQQSLPPNVNWTFRLLRETRATRHGYKRFSGVPETLQEQGMPLLDAGLRTAIETALAQDIQPAPSVIPLLAPVIVRLGAGGVVEAVNDIRAAEFRLIGTQNTRKIGRGS